MGDVGKAFGDLGAGIDGCWEPGPVPGEVPGIDNELPPLPPDGGAPTMDARWPTLAQFIATEADPADRSRTGRPAWAWLPLGLCERYGRVHVDRVPSLGPGAYAIHARSSFGVRLLENRGLGKVAKRSIAELGSLISARFGFVGAVNRRPVHISYLGWASRLGAFIDCSTTVWVPRGDNIPLLSVERILDDVHSGRRGRATTPIGPSATGFWTAVAREWSAHLVRERRVKDGQTGDVGRVP